MTSKGEARILLTVREVSLVLRVQRPKVYELIKDGVIDGFKVGADWRIRRDSVEKLIGAIPEDFFTGGNVMEEEEHEEGSAQQHHPRPSVMPS